jgi:hypothetical protein
MKVSERLPGQSGEMEAAEVGMVRMVPSRRRLSFCGFNCCRIVLLNASFFSQQNLQDPAFHCTGCTTLYTYVCATSPFTAFAFPISTTSTAINFLRLSHRLGKHSGRHVLPKRSSKRNLAERKGQRDAIQDRQTPHTTVSTGHSLVWLNRRCLVANFRVRVCNERSVDQYISTSAPSLL